LGLEKGSKKIDTSWDGINIAGINSLNKPNHESHVDEDKNSRRTFEDEINKYIKSIFILILLREFGFLSIVV